MPSHADPLAPPLNQSLDSRAQHIDLQGKPTLFSNLQSKYYTPPAARALAHPSGQPATYKPEYCEAVKAFMSEDNGLAAFGASIDASREEIEQWIAAYPDFARSVSIAKGCRIWNIEDAMKDPHLTGAKANLLLFKAKNVMPSEYKEVYNVDTKSDVSVTIKGMQNLFADIVRGAAGALTNERVMEAIEGDCEEVIADDTSAAADERNNASVADVLNNPHTDNQHKE